MIKAILSNGTMVLGLSAINIERMKEGKPILFDGRPLGYQGLIGICYGETEEQIIKDLKEAGETRQ